MGNDTRGGCRTNERMARPSHEENTRQAPAAPDCADDGLFPGDGVRVPGAVVLRPDGGEQLAAGASIPYPGHDAGDLRGHVHGHARGLRRLCRGQEEEQAGDFLHVPGHPGYGSGDVSAAADHERQREQECPPDPLRRGFPLAAFVHGGAGYADCLLGAAGQRCVLHHQSAKEVPADPGRKISGAEAAPQDRPLRPAVAGDGHGHVRRAGRGGENRRLRGGLHGQHAGGRQDAPAARLLRPAQGCDQPGGA